MCCLSSSASSQASAPPGLAHLTGSGESVPLSHVAIRGVWPVRLVVTVATLLSAFGVRADDVTSGRRVGGRLSAGDALALIEAREAKVRTLDFNVTVERRAGGDYERYWNDIHRYDRAIAGFYGIEYKPRPSMAETHNRPWPARHIQFSRNSQGICRLREYDRPPSVNGAALVLEECFLEDRWARFSPRHQGGPRVHLADTSRVPSYMAAVGLAMPELSRTLPWSIPEVLREAQSKGQIRSIELTSPASGGKHLTVQLVVPEQLPDRERETADVFTLVFDIERGVCPVEFTKELAVKRAAGYEASEMPIRMVARWEGIQMRDEGIWVSDRLLITEYQPLAEPANSRRFVGRVENGMPVVVDGLQEIDLSEATITEYEVRIDEYLVSSLKVNQPLEDELCKAVFPAGTLVQDETTGDIAQLVSEGAPTNRELLRPPGRGAPGPDAARTRIVLWIGIVNVAVLLALGALLKRRLRRES